MIAAQKKFLFQIKKRVLNLPNQNGFWLLVQIIFWGILLNLGISLLAKNAHANSPLQLTLGKSVSIYSEKAYRRDGGAFFEAIGNVVIISGKDTLYGEKASLDTKSGEVKIEGSVRYIGQSMTIYGSKIHYNMVTSLLKMTNARMITPEFSIVANEIVQKSEKIYYAKDAEFTTCRDCTESWLLSGKEVWVEIDQYIQIHHALARVKGIDVIYLPYIALPIKSKRESGVLFPNMFTKAGEGFHYEQPFYWAINRSSDATFAPTFMAERGYGLNLEYRKVFGEKKWLAFENKMVVDSIYFPEKLNNKKSGEKYFRHFFDFENHYQWNNDLSHHLKVTGTKDLDFIRDYSYYTDDLVDGNDIGLSFFTDKRWSNFNLGLEANYKRNLLLADPTDFDRAYVQTLPSIYFSLLPQVVYQREASYFSKITTGIDGDFTVFKQDNVDEPTHLRNAERADIRPYIDFTWLNLGPVIIKSKYNLDYQEYKFHDDENQKRFYKHAGIISTELSFAVERIFGLAYQEVYDSSEIADKDLQRIDQGDTQMKKKNVLNTNIIGTLPKIEDTLTKETIRVQRNSYRHSQEYKIIHHQIASSSENGNKVFESQIASEDGWFDSRDAIVKDIDKADSTETRQTIPKDNTLELQWNNVLIKKSPKKFNYLLDNKYLKDNFSYSKIGHFNVSQGFLLDSDISRFEDKLTRLYLDTGYTANTWNFLMTDYFFHQTGDHIVTMSGEKKFEKVAFLTQFNFNSFDGSNLKTLKGGLQFRPVDVLGFSILKEHDLNADENISSIYQIDFMPNNNCWIISANYKESFIEQRVSFNFAFNFGSDDFKNYRGNFFSFNRLE